MAYVVAYLENSSRLLGAASYFEKSSILDVWQGSTYTSVACNVTIRE